jgi:Cupin-like domain
MTELRCFSDAIQKDDLDRQPFTFNHQLMGHPALSLQNLERVLPALPEGHVFYSSGKLKESDNFDRASVEHPNGLSIEQTIENIRTSNSYIMVRAPEVHASFMPVFKELCADVQVLMQARKVGSSPLDAMLYLFIASPGSVTPFHIDRYSTFLMQFRGSKEVGVFPQWDPQVLSPDCREGFVARSGVRPSWRAESETLATKFSFEPGQALHIPFVAGHYVRNGQDDVSISMSIIFNTNESMAQIRAMLLNHRLRRLGLRPRAVGQHPVLDGMKAKIWETGAQMKKMFPSDS